MICFGAGGGTGSGSVLELIEIAKIYARYVGLKDPDKKVGVLMTLPAAANVGCPQVAENAHKVARQMTEMASAGEISPLIIVDNDKIAKTYPKLTAQQFYSSINATVANLFDAFNRLGAAGSEYTSFDRSDYASVIEAGGTLTMGWTKVDDFNNPFAISEAVKNNLETSLFAVGDDLSAAKVGGCIVVGNRELMANAAGLQENIDYAFDVLTEITGRATIHRGIYEDRGDGLRVYTILGGLQTPADRLEEFTSQVYQKPSEYFKNMPLRHRKEDILALADYFLAKEADFYDRPDKTLGPDATTLLLNYTWPGNVDELQKAMVRAHELTKDQEIPPEALAFEIIFADARLYPRTVWPVLAKTKRTIIAKALGLTKSVQSTARLLGIDRARLIRLIENLKIAQVTRVTDS
jgi:cell division GTPase FtsZ